MPKTMLCLRFLKFSYISLTYHANLRQQITSFKFYRHLDAHAWFLAFFLSFNIASPNFPSAWTFLFHHYRPRDNTLSAHLSVSIELWNDKNKIPLRASCDLSWKNKTYYTVLEALEAVKVQQKGKKNINFLVIIAFSLTSRRGNINFSIF